jgi:ketosteroid isomerase-like protein
VQSWLVGVVLGYAMRRLRAGDHRLVAALDADDVTLRFPGTSSFSGEFAGKAVHERWLARFAALGLQIYADQVVATGPPWRATTCVRGTVYCRDDAGAIVYDNRYVIWSHSRWGRINEIEVYEDTRRSAAFDGWVREHRPALAAPAA